MHDQLQVALDEPLAGAFTAALLTLFGIGQRAIQ